MRKFEPIEKCYEFRCFVKSKKLVAISQRDATSYYPFLKNMKKQIWKRIQDLLVKEDGFEYLELGDKFVFDVYIQTDSDASQMDIESADGQNQLEQVMQYLSVTAGNGDSDNGNRNDGES